MQVSPEFEMRIKKLQSLIMKSQGKNVSLRDLTEKVCKDPTFDDLEKSILKVTDFDLKINLSTQKKINPPTRLAIIVAVHLLKVDNHINIIAKRGVLNCHLHR